MTVNLSPRISRQIDPDFLSILKELKAVFNKNQQRLVMVGGVVRDLLLDRSIYDIDVMGDPPLQPLIDELAKSLSFRVVSHAAFSTFTLHFEKKKMDVVTAREETYPKPASLPVVSPSRIETDLKRRDFTINSMACWLVGGAEGEVLDPFSGHADIQNKKIRALHENSFVDDPTRLYRAARYAGRFGFIIEEKTQTWINLAIAKNTPALLTPVRLRHEFEAILREDNPVPAFQLLKQWGGLTFIYPGCEFQREYESSLTQSVERDLIKRMVAWFKPLGREKTEKILTHLQCERDKKKQVLAGV